LHIVADQTARLALTSSVVQNGDTVKQNDTGAFYFVIDENNLSNPSSYVVYTVGTATSVPWSGVTGRPDTLAGYGITDSALINHSHTFDSITTRPSTLSGYGITDGALDSHVHNFSTLTNKPTTINTYGITDAMRWRGTLASDPSEPIINDVYSDSTLNKLCIYNGSNWITIGVGSNSKIISEGGVEVVGPDGINTNYIKNFKNMVHNSQFEVYDLETLKSC
jgi:hypothetical protein